MHGARDVCIWYALQYFLLSGDLQYKFFSNKAIIYIYTGFLLLYKWIYESVSYIYIMKSVWFLLLAAN